jgi:hypothetical protein
MSSFFHMQLKGKKKKKEKKKKKKRKKKEEEEEEEDKPCLSLYIVFWLNRYSQKAMKQSGQN